MVSHEHFRTFGWIDCMQCWMCRVGVGPVDDASNYWDDEHNLQCALCALYGNGYGMKAQLVGFTIGII